MRFTSAVFILVQIFLSLVTECVQVEGVRFYQTKRQPGRQQVDIDIFRNMFSHPTNRKKVVLMCRNKNYLVMEHEKLKGSTDPKIIKQFGKFELQSFGVGIMKIFNVRTRKFIAFDKSGRAYTTRNNTLDTLFKVTQRNSLFVTYHSLVHRTLEHGARRKWYLAIKANGRFKRPSKTHSRHRKSIEFLPRDWRKYKLHLMNSR
ncbi:fibroblast growth factor 1 isoform X1 [Paramuricea clavata]|uniref:Fibroblast growth factor 1 isoform X1 n=1 Tax=Paramuricea clavata TaxID=317549 RepID=A0A7D9IS64_PARCT|nr:fibroblast growth factor 1 isoform X1 [Paramuricea clavata]